MKTTIVIHGLEIPCDLQVNPNLIAGPCQQGHLALPWPTEFMPLSEGVMQVMGHHRVIPQPIMGRIEVPRTALREHRIVINSNPAAWGLDVDFTAEAVDLARQVEYDILSHEVAGVPLGNLLIVTEVKHIRINHGSLHPGQPECFGPNRFIRASLEDIARRYYLTSRGMDAQPQACPNCNGPFGGE